MSRPGTGAMSKSRSLISTSLFYEDSFHSHFGSWLGQGLSIGENFGSWLGSCLTVGSLFLEKVGWGA